MSTSKERAYITSSIKRRIERLKKSSSILEYPDIRAYASKLSEIRRDILNYAEIDPISAFSFMYQFIKTHEKVIGRCGDCDNYLVEQYAKACENLGKIASMAKMDMQTIIDTIYELIQYHKYEIADNIILYFKDALDDKALETIKKKVLSLAEKEEKKPKSTTNPLGESIFEDFFGSSKNSEDDEGISIYTIRGHLCDIADCQNDVDEYILSHVYPKKSYSYNDFRDEEKAEIADRMIKCGRGKEALEWIEKINTGRQYGVEWISVVQEKKIKALELLDRHEEAQDERIKLFNLSLNFSTYKEALKNTPPELRDKFIENAIEHAFNYPAALRSLMFLSDAGYLDDCSVCVFDKINLINGTEDKILQKIADKLRKNNYNLSAVLIYRKMATDLTAMLKSSYYKRAVKALYACVELDEKISSYTGIQPHNEFYEEFKAKHKKKTALWEEYELYKSSKG